MQHLEGKRRFRQILCLTLLPALLVGAASAVAAEEPIPRINVQGEGRADIAPDMAILTLTVMREDKTARGALDANTAAMAEVLAAMRKQGIAESDLQTSGFAIQPRMHYPRPRSGESEQPPQIIGYTVQNTLTVRIRDIDLVGELLDLSVSLGVNQGGQLSWSNQDPSAALEEARKLAVQDAARRAQTLASAAGVDLGDLLELSEQTYRPGPVPVARAQLARAAEAVPLAAGENSYRVTVSASYRIGQ